MRMVTRAGVATLALLLGGCAVGPDYHQPDQRPPTGYAAKTAKSATGLDLAKWWKSLNDPQLNELVDQAILNNPDIDIALSRLQAAETTEVLLIGRVLPEVDGAYAGGNGTGSDVTRGRVPSLLTSSDSTAKTKQIRQLGGFDAVWELDLFGQYRRAIEAGIDDAEAAREARSQVLVTVIADVVRAYVDLRGLQIRLSALRQDLQAAQSSRDFVRLRFDRGLTNELDVTLAEREYSTLQAELAPLKAQIDAARFTIATLLGRYPEDLAAQLTETRPIPTLPAEIDAGLPLQLIERRPDIRAQERILAAATARVGVATGALFPHIALSGSIGAQFPTIGTEGGTHIWSFGPSAYWPLLDFGSLDALVDIADLNTRQQTAIYRRTVLNAVREVDQSVTAFAAQQDRVENLLDALAQSQRAVSLAKERYDRGLTDFLNVADAERQHYALEAQVIIAQQTAADDFVAVCRSLGGGWEDYRHTAPVRLPHPALLAMFERLGVPAPQQELPQ